MAWTSAVRAKPPATNAAPVSCARSIATSRACGYGERGSAKVSSPSSQIAISPRSRTGANTALRVPTTIRAVPRNAASHRRYRADGPNPAAKPTAVSPTNSLHAASTRSRSR